MLESWAILIFSVQNLSTNTHKVELKFNNTSEDGQFINFRIPESLIPRQVFGLKEQEVAVFTKLRPLEDSWGSYDIVASINPLKHKQPKLFHVSPDNEDRPMETEPQVAFEEPKPQNVKECPVCTFHNCLSATSCEVC